MMKKEYTKPVVQMEQFVLDIQFAWDPSTEAYKDLRSQFETAIDPEGNYIWDFNKNGVLDEEDWSVFLTSSNYDNSTSGFCYHTSNTPIS